MSVERRGDNNLSTVQRRGEKKTVLPDFKSEPMRQDYTSKDSEILKDDPVRPNVAYDVRIKAAGFDTAAFETRVQRRLAELQDDPVAKKEFLKKADGWIGKILFASIFMVAIPPLAGIVIAFGLLYLFLMSLKPKNPNRTAKIRQIAEDVVVAIKLKQMGKR